MSGTGNELNGDEMEGNAKSDEAVDARNTSAEEANDEVVDSSADDSDSDMYEDDDLSDEESDIIIKNEYSAEDTPFKMVLCVNMSLNMGKGKMCAQCGHATLGAFIKAQKHCNTAIRWWQRTGQAKVALKVDSDEALNELARMAQIKGLITYVVEDAGRTQIAAGSRTVLAIGPAPVSVFESLTGHLKLL